MGFEQEDSAKTTGSLGSMLRMIVEEYHEKSNIAAGNSNVRAKKESASMGYGLCQSN